MRTKEKEIKRKSAVEFEYDWGKENGGKVTYGQDLHRPICWISLLPLLSIEKLLMIIAVACVS